MLRDKGRGQRNNNEVLGIWKEDILGAIGGSVTKILDFEV